MKNKQKKTKQKGKSVQDLLGIKTFTKNGLKVGKEEFIFYMVQPTNISVLSHTNIEIKVRHLMMVLSAVPDIEITCTDSCECFDTNKSYIKGRIEAEQNEKVRKILAKDLDFLDSIQTETSTARQFLFIARCKSSKSENVLQKANRVEKIISDQGFEEILSDVVTAKILSHREKILSLFFLQHGNTGHQLYLVFIQHKYTPYAHLKDLWPGCLGHKVKSFPAGKPTSTF